MLNDLLRGKPRDITPHNRPTCFDGLSDGDSGGAYVVRLDHGATVHNEDVQAIVAKVIAGTPVIAVVSKETSAEVYADCVVRSYGSDAHLTFSRATIEEEDGEKFMVVNALTLGSNGTITTEYHVR